MDAQSYEGAPIDSITRTVHVKVVKDKRKVDASVSASETEGYHSSKLAKAGRSHDRFKGRAAISQTQMLSLVRDMNNKSSHPLMPQPQKVVLVKQSAPEIVINLEHRQKKLKGSHKVTSAMRTVDPKALCYEMLGDVLKVPQRNRPDRTLIKKMLIQAKHSNNVFSENKVSFRRLSLAHCTTITAENSQIKLPK